MFRKTVRHSSYIDTLWPIAVKISVCTRSELHVRTSYIYGLENTSNTTTVTFYLYMTNKYTQHGRQKQWERKKHVYIHNVWECVMFANIYICVCGKLCAILFFMHRNFFRHIPDIFYICTFLYTLYTVNLYTTRQHTVKFLSTLHIAFHTLHSHTYDRTSRREKKTLYTLMFVQ